jgi:hypothetical protein
VQSKPRLLASVDKQAVSSSRVNDKSNSIFKISTRSYDVQHPIIKLQNTVGNQAVQRLMSEKININEIQDVVQRQFAFVSNNNLSNEQVLENSLLSLSILSRRRQKQLDTKILPDVSKTSVKTPSTTLHEQVPPPSEVEFVKKGEVERTELESSVKKKREPGVDTSKETIPEKGEKEKESQVPIDEGSLKKVGAEVAVGEQPAHAPSTPEQDPAFQMAKKQVNIEAKKQRKLGKPTQKVTEAITQKVTEAMDASALTELEQKSQGSKEININEMNKVGNEQQDNTKKFDAKDFKDKFKKMVEENGKVPRTATAVKAYSKDPPIDQRFSDNVSNDISKKQSEMTGPLEKTAILEPSKEVKYKEKKEVPNPFHQAAPKQIEPKLAIPKPKTEQEVSSVQNEGVRIQNAMDNNQLSDEQLAESREPSFIQTLKIKDETLKKISETPSVYRQQESTILLDAENVANESLSSQLPNMNKIQRKTGEAIFTSQKDTEKKKTEKRQREIKKEIDGIYEKTVKGVKTDLETLTTQVKNDFAMGLENNKKEFNENVRRDIEEYYGDFRIDDKIFGPDDVIVNKEDGSTRSLTWEEKLRGTKEPTINPDVYKIFLRQKKSFLDAMDIVLDNIANSVQIGLTSALKNINNGKKEIDVFIQTLSGDEQTYANELKKEVETKFENLETSIVDTRDDLLQTLTEEYRQNVDQLEVTFNEINDELKKSWIDRAIEFVETVGKTVFELADLLLSILTRVADLVTDIIKHPIRFFETLVSGLMQGIGKFIDNIGTYLQEAFWTWVTGASPVKNISLSSASGIESLFDLVLQVLNLGPTDLRAIVEKILGRELMEKIDKGIEIGEKALEPIIILIKKGPVAFWHYIKDILESNIQSTFDRIKESVFNSFIGKALKWIAGFFIPGGGFVKIVKSIVRAFQFVAENLDRIRSFFDSVFDSMNEALQGNTEGVANKIVVGLKTGIVLALDFLAKQVGMGNVIDGVQKIIRTLRRPIVNAIEWIAKKVANLIKTVGKKLGFGRADKDLQEGETASNVIKKRAAESLDKNLKDVESLENIQKAIDKVRTELAPELKTLELEYSEEDDSYGIFASASKKTKLANIKKLGPRKLGEEGKLKETAIVSMRSEITLAELPSKQSIEKSLGSFRPSTKQEQKYTDLNEAVLIDLPPSTHPYKTTMISPGKVWVDEEKNKMNFATFNTGGNIKGTVESHAESGFIENFKKFLDLHPKVVVKQIEIDITDSTCSACAGLLSKLLKEGLQDKKSPDFKAQISWEAAYIAEGETYTSYNFDPPREIRTKKAGTTLGDVKKLLSAGWKVDNKSIDLVSEMVQRFQSRAESKETEEEAEKLKVFIASQPSALRQPSTVTRRRK